MSDTPMTPDEALQAAIAHEFDNSFKYISFIHKDGSVTKEKKTFRWGFSSFVKGWTACFDFHAGKAMAGINPYPDARTRHGSVTFSRGYRRMWARGFDAAEAYGKGLLWDT